METASKRRMVTLALRIIRRNLKMRRRRGGKNYNRAKAVHKTPNIPEEIVLHILSRLPLKSLSRFKCVSKQWHCLISDVFGKATGRHMVVIASKSNLGEASCTIQTINKEEAQVESITIPVRESSSHRLLRIFGSCNGLLLIGIDQGLFLWNPLTRYFKNVMSYDYLQDDRYEIVSGLCYNSSTNEYKAVIALAHFSPDIGGEYVVICNLRSKSATVINFLYILTEVRSGPVVNGYLHWFVPKKGDFRMLASHQIIYFNPQTDVFETIPMPHPKREDGDCMLGLGDLLGCLCMARWEHPGNTDECNVEVLAMTEYGVETSWTIMFIISCIYFRPLDQAVPLGYTKDGKALIETGSEGWRTSEGWHIWAYDPIDDSRREIVIPNAPFKFNAVTYVESLVTPSCYH